MIDTAHRVPETAGAQDPHPHCETDPDRHLNFPEFSHMHTSEETQPTPTQVLPHSNPTPEFAATHKAERMNQELEITQAQTPQIRLRIAPQSGGNRERDADKRVLKQTSPSQPDCSMPKFWQLKSSPV